MNAYLNYADGKARDDRVPLREEKIDGVTAVYIDAISAHPLDPEFGAAIEVPLNAEHWIADYRHSEFWCRPAFGTDLSLVPDETQGLIYETPGGGFGVLLPVVSERYKCVLKGGGAGKVIARLFSWCEGITDCRALAFLSAEGDNPYKLLEDCTRFGLQLLGNGCKPRSRRRYPEIFEYLGWCSWDAFQIRVNEDGLIAKCDEFKEKDIPVKWVILDDMWAEVRDFWDREYRDAGEMMRIMHSSRLYSFNADPRRFPEGLKHCVEKINGYGISVGIWHPTTGYWMGIDPDGDIYRDVSDCLIKAPGGQYVPSPERDRAFGFYCAFHDALCRAGVDFVKVDNQSMTRRFYKNMAPVGKIARDFHDALEASAGLHFDNRMINCMGMASEDMWNRRASSVSRCSDDFQPENAAWFTKHILQCSYNSLIQGQFYYCDWDMWWSDDAQAEKNAVLRAISGGPVYVSDEPGRSRREILMPLVLSNGRILRCDSPAVPSADCITRDPVTSGRIFKLQNTCNGCGIIAVFNLDGEENPVSGTVSPGDVNGLSGDEFALYEHFSKEITVLKSGEKLDVSLPGRNDYRLFIVVPLRDGCGMIGRTDKYISPATFLRRRDGTAELIEPGPAAAVQNYRLVFENTEGNYDG